MNRIFNNDFNQFGTFNRGCGQNGIVAFNNTRCCNRQALVRTTQYCQEAIAPVNTTCPLKGYQAQLENSHVNTIANHAVLKFNKATNTNSPYIGYNKNTGLFTAKKNGTYYISWWVGIDKVFDNEEGCGCGEVYVSTSKGYEEFDLKVFGACPTKIASVANLHTHQLNGSATVYLDCGTGFNLTNESGGTVLLSDMPIQANMSIVYIG